MKKVHLLTVIFLLSIAPGIVLAQDGPTAKKDSVAAPKIDSATKTVTDTATVAEKKADSIVTATPTNCYKQWLDYFTENGAKAVTDGTHEVVIAFKSKESCRCYMGKVDVVGGKIKAPLYVQTEGGEYKTFTALGKKLDEEFLTLQGNELWNITSGMSLLFRTADQDYGRIFFYKFLNKKNKQSSKEAPSPNDLLKD